ncbi:MAG: GNAT family N-acetyltransferase [Cyanobacteria bacterium J06626_6]
MIIKALTLETTPLYLEAIAQLRASVWNQQLQTAVFSETKWSDAHDQHAFHWIVLNEQNNLIASARLCVHQSVSELPDSQEIEGLLPELPTPIAMMSRLVVEPSYQRLGIARRLDIRRLERAGQIGAKSLVLQVPGYRRTSVERLGFEYSGRAKERTFKETCDIGFYVYFKVLRRLGERIERSPSCIFRD